MSKCQAGGVAEVHPLGGVVCKGHAQYPVFAPGSLKVEFVLFWSLCIFCQEFALKAHHTQLFLVPYSLLVFCCWWRSVSWCKHWRKGSQVSAHLIIIPTLQMQKQRFRDTKQFMAISIGYHMSIWFHGPYAFPTYRGSALITTTTTIIITITNTHLVTITNSATTTTSIVTIPRP